MTANPRPALRPSIAGVATAAAGVLLLAAGALPVAAERGGQGGHDAAPAANSGANASGGSSSGHSGTGDSNRGDVWVETAGAPGGPGHENDPHLPCADIALWGAGMGDPSGPYVIDSWPPSGSRQAVYSSTWHYNATTGGSQVISVVPVATLIANAQAAGATAAHNGYHFKLDLTQDPQKHKTFWINCPPSRATTSGAGGVSGETTNSGHLAGSGGVAGAVTPVVTGTGSGAGAENGVSAASTSASANAAVAGNATTGSGAGRAAAEQGGVLGLATAALGAATPMTGGALPLGASVLLLSGGAGALWVSRRRRA